MNRFWIVAAFCIYAWTLPATGHSYDNGHYKVLLEGVETWNSMKKDDPETRFDLSGVSLKGKNLKGVDFSNANLQGANLAGADLSDADLRGAFLDSAKLNHALLYDTILCQASLRDADLEGASLDGADLRDAILDGAVMKEADLVNSLLRGASLRGVDLRAANLRKADLAGCDLGGAYMWRAFLDGANLEEALVTPVTVVETGKNADESWARKNGALFILVPERDTAGAVAAEAERGGQETTQVIPQKTWPVNPVQQKIRFGATRKEAERLSYDVHQRELLVKNVSKWNKMRKTNPDAPVLLAGAKLSRKVLDGANLRNADLEAALLKRADLADADLRGANLRDANLREADMESADLGGADLRGAYLWKANLSWTVLEGAVVNASTVVETGKNATPEWAEKRGATYRAGSDAGD